MELSNKTYAWLIGGLVASIAVLAILIQNAKQVSTALVYAEYLIGLLAVLAAIYAVYQGWHRMSMRQLERQKARAEIETIHTNKWVAEQGLLGRQDIELERLRLEQMKLTLEHERLMFAERARIQQQEIKEGNVFVVREGDGSYTTIAAPRMPAIVQGGKETAGQLPPPKYPDPIDFVQVLQTFRPTPEAIYMLHTIDEPVMVPMRKVCHVGIGGTTGAGKTNITRMLTAQILACQAPMYLANPNYNPVKLNENHIEDWRPIVRLLQEPPARDIRDIERLLQRFLTEFEKRKRLADQSLRRGSDMFLVLCELPAIIAQNKDLADPIVRLLREARQYGIHVISEFQDALVSTIGGNSGARENYRTGYYGGGDQKTAQILLDLDKGERISEEGIGDKGSVYLRCYSNKARPGRVPFFSNRALYALLGTPPDPMTDNPIFDESELPETFCTLTPDGRYADVASHAQVTIIDSVLESRSGMPETPAKLSAVYAPQARQTGPLGAPESGTDAPSIRRLDSVQEAAFRAAYKTKQNMDNALSRAGVGSSYRDHARLIIQDMREKGEI